MKIERRKRKAEERFNGEEARKGVEKNWERTKGRGMKRGKGKMKRKEEELP